MLVVWVVRVRVTRRGISTPDSMPHIILITHVRDEAAGLPGGWRAEECEQSACCEAPGARRTGDECVCTVNTKQAGVLGAAECASSIAQDVMRTISVEELRFRCFTV